MGTISHLPKVSLLYIMLNHPYMSYSNDEKSLLLKTSHFHTGSSIYYFRVLLKKIQTEAYTFLKWRPQSNNYEFKESIEDDENEE